MTVASGSGSGPRPVPAEWRAAEATASQCLPKPTQLVGHSSRNQGGSDHHSLPVQDRERAITRERMNSPPITTVPRLDVRRWLFAKLRLGQPRNTIDRDAPAVRT